MSGVNLPPCRHRQNVSAGRIACRSLFVVQRVESVPDTVCLTCPYADRQPTKAERRALFPPWWQRWLTFAAALGRHATDWFRRVGHVEYDRRVALCVTNECGQYLGAYPGGRCAKCGCGIAGKIVAKARWRSESCPLEKW